MKTLRREDVWLNNTSLRGVDTRIINIKLIEDAASEDISRGQFAGRDGQIILNRLRTSKPISVEFMIREIYDLAARNAAIDAVNGWAAGGGTLAWSARPDQQLAVRPVSFVSAGDIRDYNAALRVGFETTGIPYWVSAVPATITLQYSGANGYMSVGGNAATVADVTIAPTGGQLTDVSLYFGTSAMFLSGLSVATGQTVTITHDADGILRIMQGTTGLLSKRLAASDDDLTGGPGRVGAAYTANVACDVTFSARGRYM